MQNSLRQYKTCKHVFIYSNIISFIQNILYRAVAHQTIWCKCIDCLFALTEGIFSATTTTNNKKRIKPHGAVTSSSASDIYEFFLVISYACSVIKRIHKCRNSIQTYFTITDNKISHAYACVCGHVHPRRRKYVWNTCVLFNNPIRDARLRHMGATRMTVSCGGGRCWRSV